ncbi:MAG: hypothetical protein LBC40_09640 [Dysgonamonadaceae bacterium]|nr:hypothetical protein [Dysgonamonadaceae bacterium]
MKYIYVFLLEKGEKDTDDETIIRAWKNGNAERYSVEEFTERINKGAFDDVHHRVRAIDDNGGFFEISLLHRDDLEHIGYDTSLVDDSLMQNLASKLGDDYCDQLFWDSLSVLAGLLGIPEREQESGEK